MHTFAHPARLMILGVAGVFGASFPAIAQPQLPGMLLERVSQVAPTVDPAKGAATLARLLPDLNSPSARTRDEATAALGDDENVTLKQLEQAAATPALTLEQRARLLGVAKTRFFKGPRAAMGVGFGGNLRDRIVVGQTYPPFASARLLEDGDMIIEAGGFKLEGPSARTHLQAIIISHDPGEVLPLVIRRGAERLALDIPLGNFSDLPNTAPTDSRLERAWRIRTAKLLAQAPGAAPAIAAPADAVMWSRAALVGPPVNAAWGARDQGELLPEVAGGGQQHMNQALPDEQRMAVRTVFINGKAQLVRMPIPRFDEVDLDTMLSPIAPADELELLARAKFKIETELRAMGDASRLPDDDALKTVYTSRQQSLRAVNKQRMAIQAELRDAGQPIPEIPEPALTPAHADPDAGE